MDISNVTRTMRKLLPVKKCAAVIVAAGSASRMGGIDKVMAQLHGEPMIVHSVRTMQACDAVSEIVVVTREDLVLPISNLCADFSKVRAVVKGGNSRPESVESGLRAVSGEAVLVAIHDGARPLATVQMVDRVIRAAHTYHAAAPAVPVKDTIKVVQGAVVKATPERKTLFAVQTPQVFDFDLLRGALKKAADDQAEITDDCSAVERIGMTVKIVEGDERNIKVTTPMDLKIAELLMEEMQ